MHAVRPRGASFPFSLLLPGALEEASHPPSTTNVNNPEGLVPPGEHFFLGRIPTRPRKEEKEVRALRLGTSIQGQKGLFSGGICPSSRSGMWTEVSKACAEKRIAYINARAVEQGIKVTVASPADFRALSSLLSGRNIPFHTYSLKEERPVRRPSPWNALNTQRIFPALKPTQQPSIPGLMDRPIPPPPGFSAPTVAPPPPARPPTSAPAQGADLDPFEIISSTFCAFFTPRAKQLAAAIVACNGDHAKIRQVCMYIETTEMLEKTPPRHMTSLNTHKHSCKPSFVKFAKKIKLSIPSTKQRPSLNLFIEVSCWSRGSTRSRPPCKHTAKDNHLSGRRLKLPKLPKKPVVYRLILFISTSANSTQCSFASPVQVDWWPIEELIIEVLSLTFVVCQWRHVYGSSEKETARCLAELNINGWMTWRLGQTDSNIIPIHTYQRKRYLMKNSSSVRVGVSNAAKK
ncbi:hypothetical protein HW555_012440 [Spodoptera exigua]|uniref:Uncharacterized protein n=1 Tax=Spodoptera exigua TaxID=7107 RepID=A0A835G734_SPOEX|nr:hypothetical protein HW555_012440 [Spodoptera exigua]